MSPIQWSVLRCGCFSYISAKQNLKNTSSGSRMEGKDHGPTPQPPPWPVKIVAKRCPQNLLFAPALCLTSSPPPPPPDGKSYHWLKRNFSTDWDKQSCLHLINLCFTFHVEIYGGSAAGKKIRCFYIKDLLTELTCDVSCVGEKCHPIYSYVSVLKQMYWSNWHFELKARNVLLIDCKPSIFD